MKTRENCHTGSGKAVAQHSLAPKRPPKFVFPTDREWLIARQCCCLAQAIWRNLRNVAHILVRLLDRYDENEARQRLHFSFRRDGITPRRRNRNFVFGDDWVEETTPNSSTSPPTSWRRDCEDYRKQPLMNSSFIGLAELSKIALLDYPIHRSNVLAQHLSAMRALPVRWRRLGSGDEPIGKTTWSLTLALTL